MPTPTSAAPIANLAPITFSRGEELLGTADAQSQYDVNSKRLGRDYFQYDRPRLQSRIASGGQWYSSARKGEMQRADTGYQERQDDLSSALRRQLDQFTRNRMYAAYGIVAPGA